MRGALALAPLTRLRRWSPALGHLRYESVTYTGRGEVTVYVMFTIMLVGHPNPPCEGTVWLVNLIDIGFPPVAVPLIDAG
jgi:hypothetical protein